METHELSNVESFCHPFKGIGDSNNGTRQLLAINANIQITVANYEYVFAWKLDQAAGIHLETKATGK